MDLSSKKMKYKRKNTSNPTTAKGLKELPVTQNMYKIMITKRYKEKASN